MTSPSPPNPSTTKQPPSPYPDPLIIPPLQDHKQTFIILHGRGSNAPAFAPPLLATEFPESHQTLHSAFPHAQFVFPTASKRRAQIYHRSVINQWFDNWSLQTPNERTYLQIEGLRETSAYIHSLLKSAIAQVGAKNVVLGGLSQGCAAALIALLTWDGEQPPIAAGFGMCGWLPFRKQMEDSMVAVATEVSVDDMSGGGGEDDLFEATGESGKEDAPAQAIGFLKEELEVLAQGSSGTVQRVPLFLGHGVEDEKVPVELGREAVSCLRRLGVNTEWHEYDGLGHWYSGAMLSDLVNSLRIMTSWEHTQAQ
ncbi:MAG: hypothetical protein LQ339_005574 [Xanthoria mediterranea]|nr:MAG: hypothetical protein LQ339_005574 [Xanthoria mediterranea]